MPGLYHLILLLRRCMNSNLQNAWTVPSYITVKKMKMRRNPQKNSSIVRAQLVQCQAKTRMDVPLRQGARKGEDYIKETERIVKITFPDSSRVNYLGDHLWRARLRPVTFFPVTAISFCDVKVLHTNNSLQLASNRLILDIKGLPGQNNGFDFQFNLQGELLVHTESSSVLESEQTPSFRGWVTMGLDANLPLPFSLMPDYIVLPVGNGILDQILGAMERELSSRIIRDYNIWCHVSTQRTGTELNEGSKLTSKDLIVCFGEMLIDFVPSESGVSLAQASVFKKAPGGAPANVAVAIAKFGGSSAFIGKVGEDEFGFQLVDILKENGVLDRGIRYDKNARTALAFVTLRHDGEREFMFYRNPSADMLLTKSELDVDLLRQASIFHYGSISLISEPCRSAHLEAMKIAKSAGAFLSYDPNLRLPLWPSPEEARKGILSIWDKADLIKINEEEAAFLTDGADYQKDEVVMSLWHPGLKLLLLTEGEKGCRYYTKDFRGKIDSTPVKTIDTTGAGDAYVGALLTELVKDMSLIQNEQRLRKVLRFANFVGAITTTEKGAIPALPDRDIVMSLLNKVDTL